MALKVLRGVLANKVVHLYVFGFKLGFLAFFCLCFPFDVGLQRLEVFDLFVVVKETLVFLEARICFHTTHKVDVGSIFADEPAREQLHLVLAHHSQLVRPVRGVVEG